MQIKGSQQGIKTAPVAVVRNRRAGNVIGDGAKCGGLIEHLLRGHVVKDGPRVDETQNQPWTGNAIDLRPGASDPAAGGMPRHTEVLALAQRGLL